MDTFQDVELSDGGVIEAPDEAGAIRRRDVWGNLEEVANPGEDGYGRLVAFFPGYIPPSGEDDG